MSAAAATVPNLPLLTPSQAHAVAALQTVRRLARKWGGDAKKKATEEKAAQRAAMMAAKKAVAEAAALARAPGSLAPGMRQANDFLMALQLSGAARATSLANLQVRLPAVVIGGGLTGVDTATEVQALEEMVANGTSTGKARLQIARKKVEDLERDVKEATYAASRRRTARTDTLMALCNNAAQHKLNVQDRLKELESKCVDLQSQIATS